MKTAKNFSIAALLAFAVVVLFAVVRQELGQWNVVGETVDFVFDLLEIAAIALVFAAILAPLEALGWWAGWYGDSIDQTELGSLEEPIEPQTSVVRYVIYLDGISQASFQYVPEIDRFLRQLAIALPDNIAIIRGILPYSPINRPMTEERLLAFFWRWATRLRLKHPQSWIGSLINLRNLFIVTVSADQRYGPVYNQEIAQVLYKSLIHHGYQPGSGIPITLVGYSGGGQISLGTVPYLKQALAAPIEVISLGGVFSGNNQFLGLEHFYHLVGEKDRMERLGAIFSPRRWSLFSLSYWNRAKKRGKISLISLGPVGHQVPGGIMDADQYLNDGRSHLQQTIDLVFSIIQGELLVKDPTPSQPGNYDRVLMQSFMGVIYSTFPKSLVDPPKTTLHRFKQAKFNHPSYYPLHLSGSNQYRPIAPWIGRLILPTLEQRLAVSGVWLEVHHTATGYEHLVGKTVKLRWSNDPEVQEYVRAVTQDVHFSDETEYSRQQGKIHPDRLNHWRQVDPLESLAGSRPDDDVIVKLSDPIVECRGGDYSLYIAREPVQISGREYGLVQFVQPLKGDRVLMQSLMGETPKTALHRFEVVHFNRTSRLFDGGEEIVRLPQVVADRNNILPSTTDQLELSPLNPTGWYIYGAKDRDGVFVVQAIAPRALFQLQPDTVIFERRTGLNYLKNRAWKDIEAKKGTIESVLLSSRHTHSAAIDEWQEGTCALVVHVYGGIGGKLTEPPAKGPVYFGHFAYGVAQVVHEPLADELRFEIEYRQVYTHNSNGIIAGNLAWERYMGDRQWGILGIRPVADILIKLDAFTGDFEYKGEKRSALDNMSRQLEAMMARYRIGDGTGATYVGPANNCAQDSNQALYATIRDLETAIKSDAEFFQEWLSNCPDRAERFEQLLQLGKLLKRELMPLGNPREDWENNAFVLGISLEDRPLRNLIRGLGSWRTMLPRLASDTIVKIFLEQGASVWVLRTNQVGGDNPDIEPIAPITF